MLSARTFLRLSLLALFSWMFVIGIYIEKRAIDESAPEQIVIFGVVREREAGERESVTSILLFDGEREWTIRLEVGVEVPEKGAAVIVQCACGEGGQLIAQRIAPLRVTQNVFYLASHHRGLWGQYISHLTTPIPLTGCAQPIWQRR